MTYIIDSSIRVMHQIRLHAFTMDIVVLPDCEIVKKDYIFMSLTLTLTLTTLPVICYHTLTHKNIERHSVYTSA